MTIWNRKFQTYNLRHHLPVVKPLSVKVIVINCVRHSCHCNSVIGLDCPLSSLTRQSFLVRCCGFRQGEGPGVRTKDRCEGRAGFLAPGDRAEWRATFKGYGLTWEPPAKRGGSKQQEGVERRKARRTLEHLLIAWHQLGASHTFTC